MKEKYKKILMYIGLFLILFYPFNISFKDYIFPNEFCNLLLQIIGITLICIPNFKDIVNNITNNTSLGYSSNRLYKKFDGIYTHNFTESEVKSAIDGYDEKNYKHYNVTTKSNYLYMIRETGGFMTGAYVDNSNPDKVGVNPYYDSNIGNESYLLELGYISNSTDVNTLKEEQDALAKAISDSIIKEINEKM